MVSKLLKSGVLWTKFEVRGPRKWTSKINYICICDEKNAKKIPKTLDPYQYLGLKFLSRCKFSIKNRH